LTISRVALRIRLVRPSVCLSLCPCLPVSREGFASVSSHSKFYATEPTIVSLLQYTFVLHYITTVKQWSDAYLHNTEARLTVRTERLDPTTSTDKHSATCHSLLVY